MATSQAAGTSFPRAYRRCAIRGTFVTASVSPIYHTANFLVLQTGGIAIMAKYMGNAQKIWIEGIQTRVDVTASILSSMKVKPGVA
jgi:hypothetical protein